jgi:hypothetical protein
VGLNDVMRNREINIGLRPATYAFGAAGITTSIDARAGKQRKQTSFSYAYSNRNYNHRWTLTHNTGISKKGWAFSFSATRRWADEGYVPGTYFNGWSFLLALINVLIKRIFYLLLHLQPRQKVEDRARRLLKCWILQAHIITIHTGAIKMDRKEMPM